MRGNVTGYHDSLVCLGVHYDSDPDVIELGEATSIVEFAAVSDSSQRNWMDLPDTAPVLRAHALWLPLIDISAGEVDTLYIGFPVEEIAQGIPKVPANGAPTPRLFEQHGVDAAGNCHDNPACNEVLICGEGIVRLGVDGVAIGDELYVRAGLAAAEAPGSAGSNVTVVTNVAYDGARQCAIALQAGDTNDNIRAFIFPFPRDWIEQQ